MPDEFDPATVQALATEYVSDPSPAVADQLATLMPMVLQALAAAQEQTEQAQSVVETDRQRARAQRNASFDRGAALRMHHITPHVAVPDADDSLRCTSCRLAVSDPIHVEA